MKLINLTACALMAATPLAAQTAPSAPQILSALVAQAPTALVLSDNGTPMPDGAGTALLTQFLFELGIFAPESPDQYALSAVCDSAPEAGDWACRVQLNVDWSGAESAYILRFTLTQAPQQTCAPATIEVFGSYDPCAWVIRDQQIIYLLAG